ncbi:hypothetical protein FSP39_016839 [Pinctada imbricata]|uniref:E3 ubiquitin-protein ligase PDZRN3 n=1 Tax=Pinctada imbricata TaxID=66713 RepID=A0AA88YPP2_PINIB|nr:hypothetical protein FSP39_016839 [Pinctada imbricata]
MELTIDQFVNPLSEKHLCGLCLGVLIDPVQTSCGHFYCKDCAASWIGKFGTCPFGCKEIGEDDLRSAAGVNEDILNMMVYCSFREQGCRRLDKLCKMREHIKTCGHRQIHCQNNGFNGIDNLNPKFQHVIEDPGYVQVTYCKVGCGLPLIPHLDENHDCIIALKAFIAGQENKINSLQEQIKKFVVLARSREKFLLNQIVNFQNELMIKATVKSSDDCPIVTENGESRKGTETFMFQDKDFSSTEQCVLTLQRRNNSLGFNIMGGYTAEQNNNVEEKSDNVDGEIVVSRVIDDGPAQKSGMKIEDRIMKVENKYSDLKLSGGHNPLYVHVVLSACKNVGKHYQYVSRTSSLRIWEHADRT